jgi:uncharacterized protein YegL
MPYSAEISRANPACILFLLDQSGSMNKVSGAPGQPQTPKAQSVADAVNRLISELVVSCTDGDSVMDRFHIGVITYGGEQASMAPGFNGLQSLSDVAMNPARLDTRKQTVSDGAGGLVEREIRFPLWFEPQADGATPMCGALVLAKHLLESWVASHPQSFPPIVFNITDGEPTDGDPLQGLRNVQGCGTQDGPALTFSLFLADGPASAIAYPSSSQHIPEGPLRSLVEGASVLPDSMRARATQMHEMHLPEGARGVVLQASIVDVIRLLDIGSRPVNA